LVALAGQFDAVLRPGQGEATLGRVRALLDSVTGLLDAGRQVPRAAVAAAAARAEFRDAVDRVERAATELAEAGLDLLADDLRRELGEVANSATELADLFTELAEWAEKLVAGVNGVRAQLNAMTGRPRTGRLAVDRLQLLARRAGILAETADLDAGALVDLMRAVSAADHILGDPDRPERVPDVADVAALARLWRLDQGFDALFPAGDGQQGTYDPTLRDWAGLVATARGITGNLTLDRLRA